MKPNLKFKLQSKCNIKHNCGGTNIFSRYIAPKHDPISQIDKASHYQFGGWDGFLKKNYVMCDADKFQLMHWILFNAGYSCCTADIMKRCGIDYKEWEKREMTK